MLYIIIYILAALQLVGLCFYARQLFKICNLLKEMQQHEEPKETTALPPTPIASTPDIDSKAANAERLYIEGIQNILGYDMNTMKQYLKGVGEE